MMKIFQVTLIVGILVGGLTGMALSQTTPNRIFQEVGIDQKLDEQVPLDLEFRDEHGNVVKLDQYFHSKPIILSLVYYECPMLCTQILNGMVETFRTMKFSAGEEFTVLSVSFNPRETPELAAKKKNLYLTKYARKGTADGWHFLTGEETSIKPLADAVGFRYVYDEATKQYAHASGIMVLTPEGKVARYFYGIEYVADDLRFALVEASKNQIGSMVDQLLLLCYHYDPMTGTYGFVITRTLRIAGVLTILAIGGFIVLMLRRERRGSAEAAKS